MPEDDVSQLSFEDALAELDQIVRGLEGGTLKLDAAVQAFERGVKLRRHCEAKLAEVEARVEARRASVEQNSGNTGTTTVDENAPLVHDLQDSLAAYDLEIQGLHTETGPGVYEDGTPSTPVFVMKTIIKEPTLREQVLSFFGDESPACIEKLKATFAALPGIDTLQHAPEIEVQSAKNSGLDKDFETARLVPSFMFLDPFGYEGVTAKLIRSVLKDWGCDVIFFFCFKRLTGIASINDEQQLASVNSFQRLCQVLVGDAVLEDGTEPSFIQFGARARIPKVMRNQIEAGFLCRAVTRIINDDRIFRLRWIQLLEFRHV